MGWGILEFFLVKSMLKVVKTTLNIAKYTLKVAKSTLKVAKSACDFRRMKLKVPNNIRKHIGKLP